MRTQNQKEEYNRRRSEKYADDAEYRAKRLNNHQRWREKNRERDLEKKRAHYAENKEALREKAKEYRLANKDLVSQRRKAYYEANRAKILAECKARRTGKPRGEKERNNGLKPTGFTLRMKEQAIEVQSGKCGICGVDLKSIPEKHIHADHCHISGTPRGVLCISCNHGLGRFKDDIERLRSAINYLMYPPLMSR